MLCKFFERVCAILFSCCARRESAPKASSNTAPLPRRRAARPIEPTLVVYVPGLAPEAASSEAVVAALSKVTGWGDFEKSAVFKRLGGIKGLAPRTAFNDWESLQQLVDKAEGNYKKAKENHNDKDGPFEPYGVRGYKKLEYKSYVLMSIPASAGSLMDNYCALKSALKSLKGPPEEEAQVYFSMPTKPAGNLIDCRAAAADGVGVNMMSKKYDGTGEWIVDIERAWVMDCIDQSHVRDLRVPPADWLDPSEHDDKKHGTAVAGIILGGTDKTGTKIVDGIAPGATFVKGLCFDFSNVSKPIDMLHSKITEAATYLSQNAPPVPPDPDSPSSRTGVILIELERWNGLPVETLKPVFDAIQTVVMAGHIVVQPAGNGGINLDTASGEWSYDVVDSTTGETTKVAHSLDRTKGMPMSGAITVASASTGQDVDDYGEVIDRFSPSCVTNFGSMVDCWAWGDSIGTLCAEQPASPSDPYYTSSVPIEFGKTSGASAIIAGAILLMQQARRDEGKSRLNAGQIRGLLQTSTLGTPGLESKVDKQVFGDLSGKYMPDLAQLEPALKAIP